MDLKIKHKIISLIRIFEKLFKKYLVEKFAKPKQTSTFAVPKGTN